MTETRYDVLANLRFGNIRGPSRELQNIGSRLSQIGSMVRGTERPFGGLVRNVVAFGAAYVGIRAVAGGIRSMVSGAIEFNNELSQTRIGLQSVLSAVEGIPFEDAGQRASAIYSQLLDDSITSVATTRQMFNIYQGILGPLRNAGASLETIREVTNNTVAASAALGVDFAQAQRDIMMMSSGAAGLDVKLFRMLRSTGAIAEDTQTWNQLLPAERVEKLRTALAGFSVASEQYARSWAGISSSLQDLYENFRQAFAAPILDTIRHHLGNLVDKLVEHRATITRYLQAAGEVSGQVIGRMMDRMKRFFGMVVQNWDRITLRLMRVMRIVRSLAPPAILGLIATRLSRTLLGGGLQLAGGAVSAAGAIGTAAGGVTAAGGAAALAPVILPALAAIMAAFAALAGVLLVVAGLVVLAIEHWDNFISLFDAFVPVIDMLWLKFKEFLSVLWDLVGPLFQLVGAIALFGIVAFVIGLINKLEVALNMGIVALNAARLAFGHFINGIVGSIRALFPALVAGVRQWSGAISGPDIAGGGLSQAFQDALHRARASAEGLMGGGGDRPVASTINDFRGSRIQVEQKFADADPDRVAIQMFDDINRQASARVQSGFVSSLSR